MKDPAKKERLPELDLFRAFAILGVIHVHATSYAAGGQAANSPYYYWFNLVNIFFKFGTPCFIFLSSFVLFYNYLGRPAGKELIARFYKKRLLYIIVPYAAASICYYVVVHMYSGAQSFFNPNVHFSSHLVWLVQDLASGTAYTHLYFVFINLQFYLMFPLFLLLFQKFPRLIAWALPAGFLIQWGFALWNKYDLQLMNKASYAPTYMSYYLLGAFLAYYFDYIKEWLTRAFRQQTARQKGLTAALWIGCLTAALIHVQLYHNGRAYGKWVNSLWYEGLWNIHTFLSAFVLLQASFWVYRKASSAILSFLARLGALSFAIYLLHPIFLLIYRRFRYTLDPVSMPYLIWVWAGVPVSLFLAWGVAAFTFRWIPGAPFLLGSRPGGGARKTRLELAEQQGKSAAV
ncbi:acyltransferase [Paenibacillus physcomitrellae]|uniref:Acyltransferase 3 n=1 Tax=Paenibacillus physcomitrellae TaxID=1619311 RepID=A0ABQ1GT78_9BACL|nr:acyltransferase [Paenibacillus physcomitrellae]GGA49650.1 acyltransferase 3 [Paenibacillus physcomitrellae]